MSTVNVRRKAVLVAAMAFSAGVMLVVSFVEIDVKSLEALPQADGDVTAWACSWCT